MDHGDLDLQDKQGVQVGLSRQKSMVVVQLQVQGFDPAVHSDTILNIAIHVTLRLWLHVVIDTAAGACTCHLVQWVVTLSFDCI